MNFCIVMYLSPHEPAAKPRLTSFQLRLSPGDTVPDNSLLKGHRQVLSLHEDRMNSRSVSTQFAIPGSHPETTTVIVPSGFGIAWRLFRLD
jgi:hypothetical protein